MSGSAVQNCAGFLLYVGGSANCNAAWLHQEVGENPTERIAAGEIVAGKGEALMKHTILKKAALSKPGVRAAYAALGPEFELLRQILDARNKAGLSQADVAERMGTHAPAITRLESSLGSGKHSPSINTLKRYAQAVGCELQIKLVRGKVPSSSRRAHS